MHRSSSTAMRKCCAAGALTTRRYTRMHMHVHVHACMREDFHHGYLIFIFIARLGHPAISLADGRGAACPILIHTYIVYIRVYLRVVRAPAAQHLRIAVEHDLCMRHLCHCMRLIRLSDIARAPSDTSVTACG